MHKLIQKTLKISLVSISVGLLIVFAGVFLIYFEAQSYLNKNLSELVSRKSKGKYELTFEDLQIDFKNWGFGINQISFHPTDSVLKAISNTDTIKPFYSFNSPNILFKGIRLFHLIFSDQLEIGEVLISKPELKIHGKHSVEDTKKNNLNNLFMELKPLVTKNFKGIKVHKFELKNASYDFYNLIGDSKKLSNAEDISIGVVNFYTDSLLLPDPNQLFRADDVYLRMQNYQNKLADSIHAFSAAAVTYSLKKTQIEAQNIELKPVSKLFPEKDRFSVFIENSKITTKRVKDFYSGDFIPIDSMIISGAKVNYWQGQNMASRKGKALEFSLYELIRNEIQGVSVENFVLRNAQLKLFKTFGADSSQQNVRNIRLNLEKFLLDSVSGRDTSRIFYAKNIDFSASEYALALGDDRHSLTTGELSFSTHSRTVKVKKLLLFQRNKGAVLNNTIDASCDSVNLDAFEFKKAFHQRRFYFRNINLYNPFFKLTQLELPARDVAKSNPSFVYNLISSYVKGVYANSVKVQKGKVQIVNKTGALQTGNIESNVKLQLRGFALDEISSSNTDRLFYANQIDLDFDNYQMQLVDQLHKLSIESFTLSSLKKRAEIKNLHLVPISAGNAEELLRKFNRSELYEFTIPQLLLTETDFHEAFYNKNLTVDSLNISSPTIYYENFALLKAQKPRVEFEDLFQLLSNYLGNIQVKKVEIPDGTIRLINHDRRGKTISLDNHFSLAMDNTLINNDQFGKQKLLFSEFVDFSVRDHLIRLSDNVHILKAGKIGFSTRKKEFFALNCKLYPDPENKNANTVKWNIQLSFPEIRMKGIGIEDLYFNHKIIADNMLINSPDIKLYQKQLRQEKKDIKEITIPLPKEIESIDIQDFKLNGGSLKVFSEISAQPYLLVQSDLKIGAQNLLILRNQEKGKTEFKRGTYFSQLLGFQFKPKDKNQQIGIQELSFSTTDRKLQAKDLSVEPQSSDNRQDYYKLKIPSLALNGFNLDKAYQDDQFFFESIEINQPSLQIFNNSKDSIRINPYKINLYPHFESFADVFSTKQLSVKDANLEITSKGQKKLQENLSFNLYDIRIDELPSQRFMHSNNFSFRIPSLVRKDKLYQYSVAGSSYSSATNRFLLNDIRITPLFSKEKHQKQLGFQSDYFIGKIDSIQIEQPDLRKWFENENISGKQLAINGLHLNVYRDKRLPFDDKKRPKMIQDMIRSIKYPFFIDSVRLINSDISYAEQPQSGGPEGRIRITKVNAVVKPMSNIKSGDGKYPDFSFRGLATIMDSCLLHSTIDFQMNSPDNSFQVNGYLNSFPMRILNPVLEPLASVSIRSGKVDRFQFTFSSNQSNSKGYLLFGYNDMKISVLETKNGNTKEAKLASFLANSLVLRSKNPRGKELLPDEISFTRDEKRSVINNTWRSVFSGIRNTLGIKESKQEIQVPEKK